VAVPDRLEERVREPEHHEVLHRLFAEEVVDPEYRLLGEHAVDRLVECLGRCEVVAERLLDHHARAVAAARFLELLDDDREHARRDREVMNRMFRVAELFAERGERREVAVVAIDVLEEADQLRERRLVDTAVLGEALARSVAQLIEIPPGFRDTDDRHGQPAGAHERLERRKDLLVRQVAGGAEEHERVGVDHGVIAFCMQWPICSPSSVNRLVSSSVIRGGSLSSLASSCAHFVMSSDTCCAHALSLQLHIWSLKIVICLSARSADVLSANKPR
jgi:hypothetical protein